MISRHWTAVLKPEKEELYLQHLKSETFPQLARIPGFVRATVLSRPMEEGVEFRVVTVWESLEAVREFAGPNAEAAVVPSTARELMVRFDPRVVHYDVRDMYEPD